MREAGWGKAGGEHGFGLSLTPWGALQYDLKHRVDLTRGMGSLFMSVSQWLSSAPRVGESHLNSPKQGVFNLAKGNFPEKGVATFTAAGG